MSLYVNEQQVMSPASQQVKIAEGLIITVLTQDNYTVWANQMEAAFETLDLWESHIIGELPEKIERDYKLKEFKARGILQATVSSKFKFMLCDSNGVQLDARKIWVGLKNHYVDYCERSLTRSEEAMANLQYDPRKGVEELYNTMTSLRHKIAAANIFWGEKVFASRVMAKLVSKSREWRYFEGHTVRWTDEMLSPNKFLSELIEEEIKLINMGALPRHGVDDTIYEANYASRNHRNLRKGSTSHGPNAHGAKQGNSSRDDYFAANHEMDTYYLIATANHASEVFRKPTDTAGWHKRLGHINVESIKNLADKSEGLDIIPGKTKERSQCGAPLFTHSYNLRGGGVTPSVPIAIDNVVSPKTPETPGNPGNPDCASTPIGGESEPGRRQVPRVVPTAMNTAKMTVPDRGTEVTTSDERITQELLGRGISRNKAIKTSLNESSLAGYRKPNQKPRSKSQGSRKAVQERPVDVMNRDRATMAAPTESTDPDGQDGV
ncbi:hypothetical protein BATDEDRAFT_27276 [Batrachochytrium dendrobatidis JAM81]|uniref:Uncharacterized protein n=1 Tax=Batrachochytrium dendrobatidis (strain JAM81 / FGSC 10211) TaxID=684364 RepID=F4P9Z9_BATDJ|nr:uncharacterized protein BATDEDRAFT_27276 [Batrachochytrium dendrobatidis JAM81]EGF78061.1 hypothetical protein BATDEDRAFT_27276 [Batrachochytrium dendrobatidis JAM81]|eukprot:XP_006681426.1 hypothetical protein BATDEDRAFT_27276 [Batrachochytrium dendrobatidis JAM81]